MVPMLIKSGFEVHGLDSDLYQNSNYGSVGPPGIPTMLKDIRNVQTKDLTDFDAIVHLAGLSNDPLGYLNPELTMEINYRATVRLAKLSKIAGVKRFIFSSTCSNYGAAGDKWIDETSPLNPVTPYGKSKVAAERDLKKLCSKDFSITLPRSSTAYGYSPRLRFDLVLNNLVAWAYSTRKVHLKSDGLTWRPIIHVEDISRAFLCILKAPIDKINGEAFNIGSTSENYQIKEIAQIVKGTVEGSEIEFAEDAGPDIRCYKVNCDKIKDTLGFRTIWNAKKGAREVYNVIKREGLTLEEFEGPRYRRLDALKKSILDGLIDKNLHRR